VTAEDVRVEDPKEHGAVQAREHQTLIYILRARRQLQHSDIAQLLLLV
jgi:hypothetical protein